MFRFDCLNAFIEFDDAASPDKGFERKIGDPFRAVDKMIRRVDVCRGVRAQANLRNICRVARFQRRKSFYPNFRIAFKNGRFFADRKTYIVNFHRFQNNPANNFEQGVLQVENLCKRIIQL